MPEPYEGQVRRILVGVTGASGAALGVRALRMLREIPGVESHLVITRAGRASLLEETDLTVAEVNALADVVHSDNDLGAPPASGSYPMHGMLVAPCSVKTLSAIANCYDDTLLVRAADVHLKERRPVVLLLRETPLHAGHLRLMSQVTEAGAIVMPPVPAFYLRPTSIDEIVGHTVGRAFDLLSLPVPGMRRWTGRSRPAARAGARAGTAAEEEGNG